MEYYWVLTACLSLLIILTRALPFLLAKFMTQRFNRLGKLLPAYIMMLLVIYELNLQTLLHYPYGLPALLALGFLVLGHIFFRNTLLSLIIGTSSFLIFNSIVAMI